MDMEGKGARVDTEVEGNEVARRVMMMRGSIRGASFARQRENQFLDPHSLKFTS